MEPAEPPGIWALLSAGRMGRGVYFLVSVADFFVFVFGVGVLAGWQERWGLSDGKMFLMFLIWMFISSLLALPALARRFHDLDMPGKYAALVYIPLFNIYILLMAQFARGTDGPNTYGPPPRH